jgi:diguanylate cyclase (GGDEF)-like protein
LNDEISVRASTQELLENHKKELEAQVDKRTSQLSVINRNLEAEIGERNRAEESLKHLAHHDALTGLPNRLLLDARLEHAIERAHRSSSKVAVFFLDLDNFKNINDSLGHTAGDRLLQNISQKLHACVREDDTVARLGGDEFIVILEQVASIDTVHELAKMLLQSVTAETEVGEHMISTTASIGVSIFPDDGKRPDELIRGADAAMYKAKSMGRNNYQLYTQELTKAAYHRVMLENDLRRAIDNNELEVYYQPQLTLNNRKVFGVEALVRWHHPEFGLLTPAEFLHISEDAGLITSLGEWVLRTACKQMVRWQKENSCINTLAVNLSSGQLSSIDLVETVAKILDETACDAEWLELEITENFIMKETEHAINSLNALRDLGIDIAIDDFGTGYSSLSYLKTLPINKLKIDQSFVRDIGLDTEDDAIIRAIVAMANSLEMKTIAEGIENENQEAFLLGLRCDAGQGFMYAKPMPVSELNKYLADTEIS